jgi:hypothetical protein
MKPQMSTTGATNIDPQVFDGGPPLRLQRALGVVKPGHPRVFSATTDFYTVAANVYEMRNVPFSLKDLIGPRSTNPGSVRYSRAAQSPATGRHREPDQTAPLATRKQNTKPIGGVLIEEINTLRFSAYLRVLCVNVLFNAEVAEVRRVPQREKLKVRHY